MKIRKKVLLSDFQGQEKIIINFSQDSLGQDEDLSLSFFNNLGQDEELSSSFFHKLHFLVYFFVSFFSFYVHAKFYPLKPTQT